MAKKSQGITRAHTHVSPHFHYIADPYSESYRLWFSGDASDQFYMIPEAEVRHLLPVFRRYPSMFVEGFPQQEDGTLVCTLCGAAI